MDVRPCDPDDPAASALLDQLSLTLAEITGSSGVNSFDAREMAQPGALFVLARDDEGMAVGCGAYRPLMPGVAEAKRMFAVPGTAGVGAAILACLEAAAARDGYREMWLETRAVNERAVRFYERHGYRRIANFGKYAGREEAVCFGKRIAEAAS